MSYMFYECTSITNLDSLSEWDVSNVTNMSNMFYMESIASWMGGHSNLDAKCLIEFGEEMKVLVNDNEVLYNVMALVKKAT